MGRNYYVRSGTLTILNTPWAVVKAAQIIYPFLDPFMSAKLRFFGEDF